MKLRVLELYSGIGGFHWALKMASTENNFEFEVVASIEINPVVTEVYRHNFPETNSLNRNINSLSANEINKMCINMIVMSPPCQPFCRMGLQLDLDDDRTDSFRHLLLILPQIQFQYFIVENVKGFETSHSRDLMIQTLKACKFVWQEYLLSPIDVGIPNSRLRYYLVAKHQQLKWRSLPTHSVEREIPLWKEQSDNNKSIKDAPYAHVVAAQSELWKQRRQKIAEKFTCISQDYPLCLADILEDDILMDVTIDKRTIQKYWQAIDIVHPMSTSSCCFTKSYACYAKGSGSVLSRNQETKGYSSDDIRYFTPREVLRLMCFPDLFDFPLSLTPKQQYKAIGNSLNPFVVGILITLLL